MSRYDRKNDKPLGKLIGLGIVLLFTMPQLIILLIPFGIIAGVAYLVIKNQQSGGSSPRTTQRQSQVQKTTYTRTPAFDECPQSLFCFHKDKGEHHVSRGKEIDPWDRPDIDISKYQRRG